MPPSTVTVDANGCPVGDPTSGDDDADGVPNNIDQCLTTPAGATVDPNGCAATERDSDHDGVMDNVDDCPNTPEGTDVDADGCPEDGGPYVEKPRFFGSGATAMLCRCCLMVPRLS